MMETKTFLKKLEPTIKDVGSWDNARISRAIVTTGYRNTVLEDIHAKGTPISNRIRNQILEELVSCIDFVCLVQPVVEQETIEEIEDCIAEGHEEDFKQGLLQYLSDMLFADSCSCQWDEPKCVSSEVFDELDERLCYMDRSLWSKAIAEFVLDGQFAINKKNKVVLSDKEMAIMNRDVHNRMFTVLERLDDILFGYY